MKVNDANRKLEGLEKSKAQADDKGESEEAAVGIESDGRRKEIADKHRALAEKLGPFLCF